MWLRTSCSSFKYFPKTHKEPRHTGEHIALVLRAELNNVLGDNAVDRVWSAVIDGGSNVMKASRLLIGANSQHALQTVLKYMVATIRPVAVAIGAANYHGVSLIRTGAQRGDTLTFLLIFIKFTMANIFSFGITLRIERI
jgi:hypothetical protein